MDQAVKAKWVEALRSGKYQQGQRRLCAVHVGDEEPSFCCLGVLCEISGLDRTERERVANPAIAPLIYDYGLTAQQRSSTKLPRKFRYKVGITDIEQSTLMTMNDRGNSFERIATYIERML